MSETSVVVRIRLPAPQLALFCLSFVWEELVEAQGIHNPVSGTQGQVSGSLF